MAPHCQYRIRAKVPNKLDQNIPAVYFSRTKKKEGGGKVYQKDRAKKKGEGVPWPRGNHPGGANPWSVPWQFKPIFPTGTWTMGGVSVHRLQEVTADGKTGRLGKEKRGEKGPR